mgnify:CR=1 FL=1
MATAHHPATFLLLRSMVVVALLVLLYVVRADAHPRPAEASEPLRRLQDRSYQRPAAREHAGAKRRL